MSKKGKRLLVKWRRIRKKEGGVAWDTAMEEKGFNSGGGRARTLAFILQLGEGKIRS